MSSTTYISEYQGHQILHIKATENTKYPTAIGFGKKKAQMILANIEAIRAFVSGQIPTTPVAGATQAVVPQFN